MKNLGKAMRYQFLMAVSIVALCCSVGLANLAGNASDFTITANLPAQSVTEGTGGIITWTITNTASDPPSFAPVFISLVDLGPTHAPGFVTQPDLRYDTSDNIFLGTPTTTTLPVAGSTNVYYLAGLGPYATITFTLPFTTDVVDTGPRMDEINYVWPYFQASDSSDMSNPFTYSHAGIAGGNRAVTITAQAEVDVDDAPVPEPASLALLGIGGLALLRRRRGKSD